MTDPNLPIVVVIGAALASFLLSRFLRQLYAEIDHLKAALQSVQLLADIRAREIEALRLERDQARERTPDVLQSP